MYSRNSFGSYYPIDSTMHKLNPIVKLINFILALLLMILSHSIYLHGFLMLLVFIMTLLTFVPFKYYINTLWSLRYFYIIIAFLCLYFDTTQQICFVWLMRLTILVEYLNVLAFSTSPSESIYSIEKVLSVFNFLYLPVSYAAVKINSALRLIPFILGVERKTFKAASSRGVDYYHSTIVGRVIAYFKTHSNIIYLIKLKNREIAFNSELRLFDIRRHRTNYRTNRITFNDIFFMLFHLALFLVYFRECGLL